MLNLQKASFGKRIIAAIFDFIFLTIIAVGLLTSFVSIFKVDQYYDTISQASEKYATEYNISLTNEGYAELCEQEKEEYKARYDQFLKAYNQDADVVYAGNMFMNLTLIGTTASILISVVVVQFITPLLIGNGQTLGKKIFGIALMHKDHIRISNVQLFIRAILGKFTVNTMIPVYVLLMMFFGLIGIAGPLILLVILIVQIICIATSHTTSLLHDVMSSTVAVDMASQKIFDSREELLEYTKKVHAEKANAKVF